MSSFTKLIVVAAGVLSVGSVACVVGQERNEIVKYQVIKSPKTMTCDSPFVEIDPASLPKKCGSDDRGHGRCYDRKKVVIGEGDDYEDDACDKATEVCVPEKLLLLAGKKAKSCTFKVSGMPERPGACSSRLARRLDAAKDALIGEGCDDDERCAPCIDPTNDLDTGVCAEQGVHERACVGGEAAEKTQMCCHGMGACMNLDAIPAAQQEHMNKDDCKKEGQVCAPASQVTGKPVKCDVFGMDGVCIDVCFAGQFQGLQRTTRSTCNPTEVCLPCALGKSQGMLGCE